MRGAAGGAVGDDLYGYEPFWALSQLQKVPISAKDHSLIFDDNSEVTAIAAVSWGTTKDRVICISCNTWVVLRIVALIEHASTDLYIN